MSQTSQMLAQPQDTKMFAEAASAPGLVAIQISKNAILMAKLASRLRDLNPDVIFTCARGSSDHAATYAKYLFETQLGVPTLSQAPSISSIYGKPLLHMKGQPFVLVSQSGRSPDLLASAEAAAKAGALVVAFVNDASSPLAQMAEVFVPLHAGPEKSVAATKSYIATLAAFAHLTSVWREDPDLANGVSALPDQLAEAWEADWSAGVELFAQCQSLYVLGRGLSLGPAQEAALKFKETCGIHGEAFSIAEVAHGPMALVGPDFPVLVFPPLDKAITGLDKILAKFAEREAPVAIAGGVGANQTNLGTPTGLHPVTGPIAMIQSFYKMAYMLAIRRGLDPDHPPMLRKVTETI